MSIDSLGGMSSAFDQQTFGSEVVSKTMDTMNNMGSDSAGPAITDKQTFGAAVVSKTLDYMNGGGGSSEMSQTYDFSKNVLSGYMSGQGAITDIKI